MPAPSGLCSFTILLISGGFFASALTMADGKPGALHRLIYAGLQAAPAAERQRSA
jgi:hypothetical protein